MSIARAAPAILAAIAGLAALAFTWQAGLASLYDDSVSYVLMAQWLSPFGAADPAVAEAARLEKYPPLFAALLAVSGGASDGHVAHAVVSAAFAASVYLLGAHARRLTGSAWIGAATALVFVCMPGTWLNLKGILTEFPYMAASFAALLWYDGRRAQSSLRTWLVAGALLAATLLTRTVGVALLAAIAIAEGLHYLRSRDVSRLRGAILALAIPVAAAAAWYALRPSAGEDPYAHYAGRAFSSVAQNVSALLDGWLGAFLIYWGEPWRPAFVIAAATGVLGFAATLVRAARGEADGLYIVIYLAILVAWPFPGQMYRLGFPVAPLILAHAFWGLSVLVSRAKDATTAQRWGALATLVPLAASVPALPYVAGRALAPDEAYGRRLADVTEFYRIPDRRSAEANVARQLGAFADLERIRATTPEGARVLCIMPAYMALLARRRGAMIDRPADARSLARQARDAGADYIYLSNVHPRDSALRDGNPLDLWPAAAAFAELAWARGESASRVQAVLLKVDRAKVQAQ